jgi:hypothetical protein
VSCGGNCQLMIDVHFGQCVADFYRGARSVKKSGRNMNQLRSGNGLKLRHLFNGKREYRARSRSGYCHFSRCAFWAMCCRLFPRRAFVKKSSRNLNRLKSGSRLTVRNFSIVIGGTAVSRGDTYRCSFWAMCCRLFPQASVQ